MSVRRVEPAARVALGFLMLSGVGWWLDSTALGLVGVVGALSAAGIEIWQRQCLTDVSYRRVLGHSRAQFGEEVAFDVELVNDKLLPVTWLRVEDDFPSSLTLRGGVVTRPVGVVPRLVQVLSLFSFQRVRLHMTIVCKRRGLHTIGPASLHSGDPVGYRERSAEVAERLQLLVYPKIFALELPAVAARIPLGNQAARALLGDPSRVAGVREYETGDSVRHIDWRATARSSTLLVREFDPTASLRVAVFVDLQAPLWGRGDRDPGELEFTVAVAASLISELVRRKVSTGLYSSATASGKAIGLPPTARPSALAEMLDLLARASPSIEPPAKPVLEAYGFTASAVDGVLPPRFADVLAGEIGQLAGGTSVVVIAADFPEPTLIALTEARRRTAVSTVWVQSDSGSPPPVGLNDVQLRARYTDDWAERDTLALAV